MTSSLKPPPQESHNTRTIDMVTDQMALQQELETLRRSLSTKSKKLDTITSAFHTLEDKLEDQHHAYDALRKKYISRKKAINGILKQLVQLQDQQAGEQASSASRTNVILSPQAEHEAVISDSAPKTSAVSTSFLWGLTAGICISLLLTGIGMFLWSSELLSPGLAPPLPLSSSAQPVSGPAVAETTAAEETDSKVAAQPAPEPRSPSTQPISSRKCPCSGP